MTLFLRSWHQWQGAGIRNVLSSRRARIAKFLRENRHSCWCECATRLDANWTMDAVLIARDFEANLVPFVEVYGVKNPDALMLRLIQYVARTAPLSGEIKGSRNSVHRLALTNGLGSVSRAQGEAFMDAIEGERIAVPYRPSAPAWLLKALDPRTLSDTGPRTCTRCGTGTGTEGVRDEVPRARALSGLSMLSGLSEREDPPTPLPRGDGPSDSSPEPEALAAAERPRGRHPRTRPRGIENLDTDTKRAICREWAKRQIERTGFHDAPDKAQSIRRWDVEKRTYSDNLASKDFDYIRSRWPDQFKTAMRYVLRKAREAEDAPAASNGHHPED